MGISAPPPVKEEGPERVLPIPRLQRDAHALLELINTEDPPYQHYWRAQMMIDFYIHGDANGAGFVSALIRDNGLLYEAGT